jgi:hypothetical protein
LSEIFFYIVWLLLSGGRKARVLNTWNVLNGVKRLNDLNPGRLAAEATLGCCVSPPASLARREKGE